MKTIYLLITCLLIQWGVFAQEGVNFRDLTFNEALAQAKAEKKMVFMDCYTSWCGPCKNMTNNVFPQKAAGDYFNPRFVPYLNERYEKGKMNKQELMTYKEILSEAGEDEKAGKVYKELLPRLTSKDKVQKEFWTFIILIFLRNWI